MEETRVLMVIFREVITSEKYHYKKPKIDYTGL